MEFSILTEEEYDKFSKKRDDLSFFQTVENAHLRKMYGAKIHYLGVKENNKIIMGGMFTENPCMFGKKRFYAPQGFLGDYKNIELLRFFTNNLKKYAKSKNAMFIKIDPPVIYQIRDVDGNIIEGNKREDEVINNLKSLGYKHFGFTKDYRFSQSRWNFRLELDVEYDLLKKRFSKSTRKNIDNMYEKGVSVIRGTGKDLDEMTYLLQATAKRKGFMYRTIDYYKNMYDCYKDLMQIYIAHVDSDKYLKYAKDELEKEKQNNKVILEKMEKDMVGSKLKNNLETSNKRIERLKEEVKYATEFNKEYPDGKNVGGLLSIKSGNEYITLTSGILEDAKRFMPKYIMYNEHILDAYKYGFKYVNFYGISGVFDKSSPIYGVYEFKKGWTGNVVELVGEFTYKVSNTYYIYNMLRHLKILIRNITKR